MNSTPPTLNQLALVVQFNYSPLLPLDPIECGSYNTVLGHEKGFFNASVKRHKNQDLNHAKLAQCNEQ